MNEFVENNYDSLREWYRVALDIIWRIPPNMTSVSPFVSLIRFEEEGNGRAVKPLAGGIADTIAMSSRFAGSDLAAVDREFSSRGLPTLSELRILYRKELKKIIGRGEILDDDEYYVVREARDAISNADAVKQIDELIANYENKGG
jgi:hypothetical protein